MGPNQANLFLLARIGAGDGADLFTDFYSNGSSFTPSAVGETAESTALSGASRWVSFDGTGPRYPQGPGILDLGFGVCADRRHGLGSPQVVSFPTGPSGSGYLMTSGGQYV